MPPGLIKTAIDKDHPFESISGYDPERIALDEQKDTVQGQLQSIFAKDSPLLQGARTRAAQASNARGLLNSSMAVQAGEEAVHGAALPIAQQDAATNFQARTLNQAAGNRGMEFTAGAGNVASLQEAAGEQQLRAIGATGEQQRQSIGTQATADIAMQTLKGTQATGLAEIEARYKNLMQTSASASTMFTQMSKNIADILNDPNTSVEQKQNAVNRQTSLLQSELTIIGEIAGVDLAGLLDFSTPEPPPPGPAPEDGGTGFRSRDPDPNTGN